jgi:hypothetical protein
MHPLPPLVPLSLISLCSVLALKLGSPGQMGLISSICNISTSLLVDDHICWSEVLKVIIIRIIVFLDVTCHSSGHSTMLEILPASTFMVEDGGNKFFQNVGAHYKLQTLS